MLNFLINDSLDKTQWGRFDYREMKEDVFFAAQGVINRFRPLSHEGYSQNPIQLIDFFCGAGGTTLGFAALNMVMPAFRILGGCDINVTSARTYSRNFGTKVINQDVVCLANEDHLLEELLESINYDPELPTILIGCAPCQGFSSHRKKHWNEEDDIRNSLIVAFAKIVERMTPDAIVIENVPEFLSQRYWRYFIAAKEKFTECGYVVKQNIYNAASFGVPQERFRSIIIGMKKEFLMPVGYFSSEQYKTVRDAIGDLPPIEAGMTHPNDPLHKCVAHRKSTIDVIRQVPRNGGSRPFGIGPACLDKTKGFSDVYGRLCWDKPSITITHYARNPASGRYSHPEQDRGLTAREAACLQSFPRGFEFIGSTDDIYRQIGEAVPPLLAVAIATDVLIELVSKEPTKEELYLGPKSITVPVSSSYSSLIAGIKMKKRKTK